MVRAALVLTLLIGCRSPAPEAPLAPQYGADEHGMRHYVIAFLKPGPKRDQRPEEAQAIQRGHMANIERLAKAGKLVLAGPFEDPDGPYRGLFVFDVATIEEARALTATDPAVQSGRLEMELHRWYGSAALKAIPSLHDRLTGTRP